MKRLLLMATIVTTMLACSNDEVISPELLTEGGEKSISLTIIAKSTSSTKSVDDEKLSTEYPTISSVMLYFRDDSGEDVFMRELTSDEVAVVTNTSSTSSSGTTLTITGVPSTAKTLYVVANTSGTDNTTLPAIEEDSSGTSVLRIDYLQGDANTTPLSGESAEFAAIDSSTTEFSATAVISPIVARIEVSGVSYTDSGVDATSDITSYQLGGVYINNIQPYVTLDGVASDETLVDVKSLEDWADDWEKYFDSNELFPYYTGGSTNPTDWTESSFVDYCTQSTDADLTFYPDETDGASTTEPSTDLAWAYQVVPATSVASLPHIILRLDDVAYNGSVMTSTTRYVTVTNYQDSSGSAIESFERGNVYRITNLAFSHSQATNKPYVEDINVTATLQVTPWVVNEITPDWSVD